MIELDTSVFAAEKSDTEMIKWQCGRSTWARWLPGFSVWRTWEC